MCPGRNAVGGKVDFFFFFWINLYSGLTDTGSSPVAVHVLLHLANPIVCKGPPPLVRINWLGDETFMSREVPFRHQSIYT